MYSKTPLIWNSSILTQKCTNAHILSYSIAINIFSVSWTWKGDKTTKVTEGKVKEQRKRCPPIVFLSATYLPLVTDQWSVSDRHFRIWTWDPSDIWSEWQKDKKTKWQKDKKTKIQKGKKIKRKKDKKTKTKKRVWNCDVRAVLH